MHAKVLNKRLAIEILLYKKRITHYDQVGFIPRTQEQFSVSNPTHKLASQQIKEEEHMTIPKDAENSAALPNEISW